jgi:D-glycero-D-manno-heptose 1,7-bisphosphate phosphatase
MTNDKPRILIGLDRDGTINYDPGYFGKDPKWKDQTKLLPGVVKGIKILKQLPKTRVVVCSNQAGVARGYFDIRRVEEINKHINSLLAEQEAEIDSWYYCPYVDQDYAIAKNISHDNPWISDTDLRKPGIGMLRKAALDVEMKLDDFEIVVVIGDKASDVETGLNAGGYGIYVDGVYPKEKEKVEAFGRDKMYEGRVFTARDLQDAAEQIKIIQKLQAFCSRVE